MTENNEELEAKLVRLEAQIVRLMDTITAMTAQVISLEDMLAEMKAAEIELIKSIKEEFNIDKRNT